MKDISIYFSQVPEFESIDNELSSFIEANDSSGFPEIDKAGIAIIHVPEYRNSEMQISDKAKDSFRKQLYRLHRGDAWDFKIYDLGTIQAGEKIEDTYFALSQSISELIKKDVIPVIIGGSQDITMACYSSFENLERTINICAIDHALNVGDPDSPVKANAYVSHLLMQRPCYLFNYANVGMQRPLVAKKEIDLFEKLYFDICRLGEFNQDFKRAEPHLRNADLLTVDFDSIKSTETDNNVYHQPNGFKSDQICQVAKYAGISDKMSCMGIFNVNPSHNSHSASLLAQIIWYFIDGVAQRVGDFPIGSKMNYKKFHVHLDEFEDDLVFYKSEKSGRWWLEVSYKSGEQEKYERHHMVPCDYDDYQRAIENNIPDLWWKTLQKLS